MPIVSVNEVADKAFDHIIIGTSSIQRSSAGLLLASRLSEDADRSVLVLDAGNLNEKDPLIMRPGQHGHTFTNPVYDWGFKTTPQEKVDGRQLPWFRGKSLGGSSAMNFMCWTVPPKEDIDDWERLGNPGINWNLYERCVKKVATYSPPNVASDIRADAAEPRANLDVWKNEPTGDGPLKVTHPKSIPEFDFKFLESLHQQGLPVSSGPISGSPNGTNLIANTFDPADSSRSYAATAFFYPNQHRANLSLLVAAEVSNIITRSGADGLEATGVEFVHREGEQRTSHVVHATKEVTLCAGTLKSAQILELSGIGRQDVLNRIGVPVKLELDGVGENIQDHTFAALSFELNDDQSDTWDVLSDPDEQKRQVELYAKNEGVYTLGITAMSYSPLSTVSTRAEQLLQDTKTRIEQDILKGAYSKAQIEQYEVMLDKLGRDAPGYEFIAVPGTLSGPNLPEKGKKYLSVCCATNYSFSRGTIHATSKSAGVDPECDPKYFAYDVDRLAMTDMVKFIRKAVAEGPLKTCLSGVELNPGAKVQTDEEIDAWVKGSLSSTWHAIGATSMLPKEKGGVVDTKLKVYGTKNIRVADLSVVPLHIAAHTLATAYVIGQYASEVIRAEA
ncbi:GMC oxidoreductase [Cylindrobasidium torrendii FP15055 ss-10]|uniref:GMC oxidoreductase n=1 Tax=Cylindrobasidium torrendii FP15055 ss-10 TaxID=1314674 RepID=A0A0D7B1K5_9AGAR|nr:GMC oxidoreductase [Cylindrobasidium torrendii FP15055 ss-10]